MQIRVNAALTVFFLVFGGSTAGATTSTGRLGGSFVVSPRGSSQYSIPLWTPPGIRGLQPSLALMYDSQTSYGLMGPGWTLSGLSTIARCNPTYAQDTAPAPITLTTADALCIGGNRLRMTSTGVYQTEVANFSQVTAAGTAGNGPSYFTVQGKDGLTYEYGNTTDSKILPASGSTPYLWALDKVTDRAGNQMAFTYIQSGGAYVPSSIQYTAPSGSTSFPYKVSFGFSTKATQDTLTQFIAGASVQQTEQLSTITVTNSGTTVREYKLGYTTSLATLRATLTSVQECGGSAGNDCLTATSVGYQSGTAGVGNSPSSSGSGATNGSVYTVDIDGDGRQDLIFAVTNGSTYQWWVQFATGTGYGSPINTGATSAPATAPSGITIQSDFLIDNFDGTASSQILSAVGGVWYVYKWNGTGFTATSTGTAVIANVQYASADVDGDGLPDLVSASFAATSTFSVQLNTTTSAVSFAGPVVTSSFYTPDPPSAGILGDNQLANSSVKKFDFDGDGRQDLFFFSFVPGGKAPHANVVEILSRGTATAIVGGSQYLGSQLLAVNWNDDACTDFITGVSVLVSQCSGNAAQYFTLPTAPSVAIDWDGDGRTDALANVSGTWQLSRSEGNAVAAPVSTGISVVGTGAYLVTDFDGDGLDDLAFANSTASNSIFYEMHNGEYTPPDLANSFIDGFGNAIYAAYASIAQPATVYTATNDQVFPYQNFLKPFYVTTHAIFSDPSTSAGEYAWDYQYEGASFNLQGRGFGGFSVVQKYDTHNGLYDSSGYSRAFPTTGLLAYDVVFSDTSGVQTIVDTSLTLTFTTLDGTANNQRYFPYASTVATSSYEVGGADNGQLKRTTSTAYTYDSYGNATTVATTITDDDSSSPTYGDQYVSTRSSTITPNTANWCLSLPTQSTVSNSSNAPGGASITRTISFTPDYANCRATQQVVEPSSSLYQVTTVYGFDGFGNINSQAVTGVGMPTRTTTINWGTSGQFPTVLQDPLGSVVTQGYDAGTGRLTSRTDPNYSTSNPLTTTWTYDDFGRKTQEKRPDGMYTTWQYNDCATSGGCVFGSHALALLQTVFGVNGTAISNGTTFFDQVDRPLVTTTLNLSGGYNRTELRYDSLGRVSRQAMPCTYSNVTTTCTYWTTNSYDALNRLTESQRPISSTNSTLQTTLYSYAGRTSTVQDALNNTFSRITSVTGNVVQSGMPRGFTRRLFMIPLAR